MEENQPIKIEKDGITFLAAGKYYEGINQWVAHKIKEGDGDAIDYAARQMSKLLPRNAVLVPIPGHHGIPVQTLRLAKTISYYTDLPVADVLRGNDRESQYEAKHRESPLTAQQMGYYKTSTPLPNGCIPFLVDNVVDTGTTVKVAVKAIGSGTILSYAMSDTLLESIMQNKSDSLRR